MQPTSPKIILLALALIAVFMPCAFTAEYSAPATLTSLGTQPWTADEKTRALVGSTTVDFLAKRMDSTSKMLFADTDRGPITVAFYTPTMAAGASATYTITKAGTNTFSFLITSSLTYYSGTGATSDGKIVVGSGGIATNGALTNYTSTIVHPGSFGASTTVTILGNGVDATDIIIRFTNNTAVTLSSVICRCDLTVLRGNEFAKE